MPVTIHYFRSSPPNFGDELNAFLWQRLIPELDSIEADAVLVGIGTILDHRIPTDRQVFVFGSGAGLAELPRDLHSERVRVLAVRGPLTAAMARLDPKLAVTDPALLLRSLYTDLVDQNVSFTEKPVVFVPHVSTAGYEGWRRACDHAGIDFVDPRADCMDILRKISAARLVIAEAMHAAIVADAFRVPWIPVASGAGFSAFKWLDWTLSLDVPFAPVVLPPISLRQQLQDRWLGVLGRATLKVDLAWLGNGPAENVVDAEPLMRNVARRIARQRSAFRCWTELKLGAAYSRLVDPAAELLGTGPLRSRELGLEQQVAETLAGLANQGGYLSSERISMSRLQVLHEKAAVLRSLLTNQA